MHAAFPSRRFSVEPLFAATFSGTPLFRHAAFPSSHFSRPLSQQYVYVWCMVYGVASVVVVCTCMFPAVGRLFCSQQYVYVWCMEPAVRVCMVYGVWCRLSGGGMYMYCVRHPSHFSPASHFFAAPFWMCVCRSIFQYDFWWHCVRRFSLFLDVCMSLHISIGLLAVLSGEALFAATFAGAFCPSSKRTCVCMVYVWCMLSPQ